MVDRRRGFRAARRFALLGCVVLASACGGGGGGAPGSTRFAYAANVLSNDISAYTVNTTTGALTRIDCGAGPGCNGANFAAGSNPRSVRSTPDGKFLYVANQGSGDV